MSSEWKEEGKVEEKRKGNRRLRQLRIKLRDVSRFSHDFPPTIFPFFHFYPFSVVFLQAARDEGRGTFAFFLERF